MPPQSITAFYQVHPTHQPLFPPLTPLYQKAIREAGVSHVPLLILARRKRHGFLIALTGLGKLSLAAARLLPPFSLKELTKTEFLN